MIKKKLSISMIDMNVMHDVFGSNYAAMQDYLKNFIKVTSEILKKAETAIQNKDQKSAHEYFHQLKGPVGTIKFSKLYNLCGDIEKKIAESDWDSVNELYSHSDEILKKLEIEIEHKFKGDSDIS